MWRQHDPYARDLYNRFLGRMGIAQKAIVAVAGSWPLSSGVSMSSAGSIGPPSYRESVATLLLP